jgi:hypothetical protein
LLVVAALLTWLPAARAVDRGEIDKARDRGVQALKKLQKRDGLWPHASFGATALAALTLLECGVPRDDPAITTALTALRKAVPEMKKTYAIATSVLILDRLGDPRDVGLIDVLVIRLLAGQSDKGGWAYDCHLPDTAEGTRLSQIRKDARGPFPRELEQAVLVAREVNRIGLGRPFDDNSNTQFALLALWAARRSGWPVEEALFRAEKRLRGEQLANGAWPYRASFERDARPTMTCVGIMGLAMAHGAAADAAPERVPARPALARDAALHTGLNFVANHVGQPQPKGKAQPVVVPSDGKWLYFLWSVERVCMVLHLQQIGGKDWYGYGTEVILAGQKADGTWEAEFGPVADTCFALLFLERVNLATDLTKKITELRTGPPPRIKTNDTGPPKRALNVDTENGKLAARLVRAEGADQLKLLAEFKERKGVVYTEALAAAIPHLEGDAKTEARNALAQRLARMKAESLAEYLKDEEAEIRRGAALAAGMKDSKTLIPNLIPLLKDPEPIVPPVVLTSLKALTGQDLGTEIKPWQEWWDRQKK